MFRHDELAETVKKEIWFHSIDLGHCIVTKGQKTQKALAKELSALRLPDVRGKEVLDIGALDGFYSFEAEQRGARKVVALDFDAWQVETNFSEEYRRHCLILGMPILTHPIKPSGSSGPVALLNSLESDGLISPIAP